MFTLGLEYLISPRFQVLTAALFF